MLPATSTDPFRSLTFDQYDALTEHLEEAQQALALVSAVLGGQTSGDDDRCDAPMLTRTRLALLDRAEHADEHLTAIATLLGAEPL